jgi:delta-aminolevulinic acid dehydratase/porphobilinogen synthase
MYLLIDLLTVTVFQISNAWATNEDSKLNDIKITSYSKKFAKYQLFGEFQAKFPSTNRMGERKETTNP